ncbi:tetratricopeptide repeat protein [Pelobium manganitolerans]|uniref:tetratricopeptide repeat protein n=1 Tax=Pelobium manganitolerans TaxID=1842495 RepID=UPI0016003799|nr:tetratricopeptide repeat protein [Pelobium manganitolerans]
MGEARVSNNIANIWVDIDYEKSLVYFKRVLKIALKRNVKDLTAGAYLNIGNAYYQNKQYKISLDNYEKSRKIFTVTKNTIGLTQSLQNIGLIYYRTGNLELAENYLLLAKARAQEYSLNNTIAMLNLTLSSIYMAKNNFPAASNCITEGLAFANLIGDEHRKKQFIYSLYELEKKQNNFKEALGYLKEVYIYDSLNYRRNLASNIGLVQQTFKQQQTQKENELTIQSQRNAKKLSLAIGIVAVLSFFVIFLLIKSNRRSKESNQQLQELNDEIITQKNKVDRINHQLEELIAERTKDLIIKNQKLSEYSSHLSHQIRGPVATLKGLMMLVEENMVQSNEIAPQIKKCVDDIDTKIMDINDALNDPTKKGLS